MKKNNSFRIIAPQTKADFDSYYQLRYDVLRKPWGQPENTTRDEWEKESIHVMMIDESDEVVAVGRLQFISEDVGQIRSMAVREEFRKFGLGTQILKHLEKEAVAKKYKTLILDARNYAVDFYLKNGYKVDGDSYLLFGVIPHFKMSKTLV